MKIGEEEMKKAPEIRHQTINLDGNQWTNATEKKENETNDSLESI